MLYNFEESTRSRRSIEKGFQERILNSINTKILLCFFLIFFCNLKTKGEERAEIIISEPESLYKYENKVTSGTEVLIVKGNINKIDLKFIAELCKKNSNIKSIDISKTEIRELGMGMFENCTDILSINLPSTLKTIGKNAFKGCSKLAIAKLPQNVTSIGTSAFEDCKSLKEVSFRSNVSWIGQNAFTGCDSLETFRIRNKNYSYKKGILKDKYNNIIFEKH